SVRRPPPPASLISPSACSQGLPTAQSMRAGRVSQRGRGVYTAGAAAAGNGQGDHMATYVLVHGAYQGGWIWKPVAERLRAAGHRGFAPTLGGCRARPDPIRPRSTVATTPQQDAKLHF